jgi:hypothetical protein
MPQVRRLALLAIATGVLVAPTGASAAHFTGARAATNDAHYRAIQTVVKTAPTLEQLAYRYWGDRLERACPNGSLRFIVSPKPPAYMADATEAQGGSLGDCRPWVRSGGYRAETCSTALHEAGHETGLPDAPGAGGLMDNTRLIIGSIGLKRVDGKWLRAQRWTNVPSVCQPVDQPF